MRETIRWGRVLLEGAVIVGSILLAFGIQAWWDGRHEAASVRRALAGALEELAAVDADLTVEVADHQAILSRAEALQTVIGSAGAQASFVVPDTLLGALFYDYVADFPSGMVEALIASGHLDNLRNEDLRRSLLTWLALLEDQRDDQTRASAFGSGELQPYLRAEYNVVGAEWADRRVSPIDGHLSTDIVVTTRLRNLVVWQLRWLNRILRQGETIRQRRVELDSLIRAEIRLH